MLPIAALLLFFGLAVAAPQGARPEEKIDSGELVLRLAVHVHKTPNGARLVFNLEETPETETAVRPASATRPIISVGQDWPIRVEQSTARAKNSDDMPVQVFLNEEQPRQNTELFKKTFDTNQRGEEPTNPPSKHEEKSSLSFSLNKSREEIKTMRPSLTPKRIDSQKTEIDTIPPHLNNRQIPQRLQFKISLGGMQPTKPAEPVIPIQFPTEQPAKVSSTRSPSTTIKYTTRPPIVRRTTEPITATESVSSTDDLNEDEGSSTDLLGIDLQDKAFAEGGFGVLTSRCAALGAGLVSDGAGGCTKLARMKKKHSPVAFKSAGANELHADMKTNADEDDVIEVINIHDL